MGDGSSEEMMLVPQVAKAIGVSPGTVRRYVDAGLIDAVVVKNGSRRTIRFRRVVVCQFVRSHVTSNGTTAI
jgi:predicted site-specific integrase-resolvase